ncbi:hypothetical protein Pint_32847 [Pistacia integerrima]|uniref:Uncharacterized protein n=1 Tax=Pistacia integerrima TaxID=434235 RepID=A0ACC0X7K1_9ROSI|nr:hypothetical protein Pint_32847 [Pistacia integerrima]
MSILRLPNFGSVCLQYQDNAIFLYELWNHATLPGGTPAVKFIFEVLPNQNL